mmetsp:Transcript_13601/g.33040  ORF Transcript_13601/g.33040 Transcript_13601/m.33040 type:complete len:245 (+) Transcript_13601:759-1493(+)
MGVSQWNPHDVIVMGVAPRSSGGSSPERCHQGRGGGSGEERDAATAPGAQHRLLRPARIQGQPRRLLRPAQLADPRSAAAQDWQPHHSLGGVHGGGATHRDPAARVIVPLALRAARETRGRCALLRGCLQRWQDHDHRGVQGADGLEEPRGREHGPGTDAPDPRIRPHDAQPHQLQHDHREGRQGDALDGAHPRYGDCLFQDAGVNRQLERNRALCLRVQLGRLAGGAPPRRCWPVGGTGVPRS